MDSNNRSEVDGLFTQGDLTTLVDLQKFLAEELVQGAESGVDLSRAFTPLTDGLGIHHTGKPAAAGATKAGQSAFASHPAAPAVTEFRSATAPAAPPRSTARLFADEEALVQPFEDSTSEFVETTPPPVPSATLGRRFMAGIVDQGFVVVAWLLALAITSNAVATGGDVGARFLKEFADPVFLRSAGLEFGMIWIGYLILSFGFLDMTFGMWVWGLRVNYGETGRFWKRLARVILSAFFYPAIVPTVLLALRREGRTLIDSLTQSTVYRSLQN